MNSLKQEIMRTHAAVARGERGAKAKLERLQAEYRTSGATIERPGGSAVLTESRPVTSLRPRRVKQKAQVDRARPFDRPCSAVEIRSPSTEPTQYTVKLGSGARRAIEDELALVRRELGPDFECGGWLYGQYRPRESSTWTTIAVATHAGNSEHGRSSITFGESATSLMLRSFPPDLAHLTHLGDWHSHPNAGSTIPSDGDARGWARSCG